MTEMRACVERCGRPRLLVVWCCDALRDHDTQAESKASKADLTEPVVTLAGPTNRRLARSSLAPTCTHMWMTRVERGLRMC